jgi:hypothetical protein
MLKKRRKGKSNYKISEIRIYGPQVILACQVLENYSVLFAVDFTSQQNRQRS